MDGFAGLFTVSRAHSRRRGCVGYCVCACMALKCACARVCVQVRGLYKGATPPLLATGFINSVLFGMMGMCKSYKQGQQDDKTAPLPLTSVMWCGMTTGA